MYFKMIKRVNELLHYIYFTSILKIGEKFSLVELLTNVVTFHTSYNPEQDSSC